jgi:hypothetical protein
MVKKSKPIVKEDHKVDKEHIMQTKCNIMECMKTFKPSVVTASDVFEI